MILSEKKLRNVIREEFEKLMTGSPPKPDDYSIKSAAGGEIIMPSFTKQQFDEGKVKSIKDII